MRSYRGELFVFEGPDGVGKSTLSAKFAERLQGYGIETDYFSFPGQDLGTLGRLIYDLHHNPTQHGIESLSPASMQTLHLAAHLDAIERLILPALMAGRNVVLDRYWWSTWVYGTVDGVPPTILKSLLRAEREQWGKVFPCVTFLITREQSWRDDEANQRWERIAQAYRDLVQQERGRYPIVMTPNESSVEDALGTLIGAAVSHSKSRRLQLLASVKEDFIVEKTVPSPLTKGCEPQTTKVFDTYWKFAAERQAIFFRRLDQAKEPWSVDPILQKHKFTNAYRASDRVSQFLIRHVIYQEGVAQKLPTLNEPDEIFFRVLFFKVFNRISTWCELEAELGGISLDNYEFDLYANLLSKIRHRGECIFSSAYIMPSGSTSFGYSEKHRNYLKLLERMIEDEVPWRLQELKTMRQAFELLLSYPTMGNFLAYQFITDLNYSSLTDFSEMDFVVPGPGARDGIVKCFSNLNGWSEADIIRWTAERQETEFAKRGIDFQDLWGRKLQLIDCQNLFCEVDKYARVAHPDVQGLSGRTRIKQLFQPVGHSPTPWYPPKWALNEKIVQFLRQ